MVTNPYPNPFLPASQINFSPVAPRLLPALSQTENRFSSIPLSPVTSPSCSPATSQASPSSSTPTGSNPPATPSATIKPIPSSSTTASSTYASATASTSSSSIAKTHSGINTSSPEASFANPPMLSAGPISFSSPNVQGKTMPRWRKRSAATTATPHPPLQPSPTSSRKSPYRRAPAPFLSSWPSCRRRCRNRCSGKFLRGPDQTRRRNRLPTRLCRSPPLHGSRGRKRPHPNPRPTRTRPHHHRKRFRPLPPVPTPRYSSSLSSRRNLPPR